MFAETNGEAVDRTSKVFKGLHFASHEYDDAVTIQSNKTFSSFINQLAVSGRRLCLPAQNYINAHVENTASGAVENIIEK